MSHKFVWPKFSFAIFLFSLIGLLLFGSYLSEYQSANVISRLFITLILLTSVYLLSHVRKHLIIAIVLSIPTISMNWASVVFSQIQVQNISLVANIIFFGYIATLILMRLFQAREVNVNMIFAAVSLYFLIGLQFGYFYALIEWNHPGSLTTSVLAIREDLTFTNLDESLNNFFYFSLTTLTTVGYGDIIPVSALARSLSNIEAVFGQMYLTVLVARLVGMHLTQKQLTAKDF